MNLGTMRDAVEADLKDTTNARWSTTEIDRAIARAVADYQEVNPLIASADVEAAGERWFDLSGESGYLWCESVEYPIDADSPAYRPFRENRASKAVYVLGDAPTTGEDVRFWCAKVHTLDADGSTIPTEHENVIAMGAAGYAALEYSAYSIDRINASGWTPRQWRDWAEWRLKQFNKRLAKIGDQRLAGVGGAAVSWGSATI